MRLSTLAVSCTLLFHSPCLSQIVLNEVLAAPGTDWNLDGAFSSQEDEWVEISNAGAQPVDVTGWLVGDSAGGSQTPRFGLSGTLQPGEHLLITGSMSRTWESANGFSAVGLSLNNSGDTVSLFQTAGGQTTLVDSAGWTASSTDVSIGRLPDGTGTWQDFDALTPGGSGPQPTPGDANGGPAAPKVLSSSVTPGFPTGADSIRVEAVCADADGITQTLLLLTVDADPQQQLPMTLASGGPGHGTWERVIGPYPGGTSLAVAVRTHDGTSSETTGTDSVTVAASGAPVTLNEILADPPPAPGGDANNDGVRDTADDEFVEIMNTSSAQVDLGGWEIHDGTALRHVFPQGTVLEGGEMFVVFGGGAPTGIPSGTTTASTGGLSLNNGGDSVLLRDSGGVVQDAHSYGSEAGADQSLIRLPDGTGPWTRPGDQGITSPYSPGRGNGSVTAIAETSWGKVKSMYR